MTTEKAKSHQARFLLNGQTFEGSRLEITKGQLKIDGEDRGSILGGFAKLNIISGTLLIAKADVDIVYCG